MIEVIEHSTLERMLYVLVHIMLNKKKFPTSGIELGELLSSLEIEFSGSSKKKLVEFFDDFLCTMKKMRESDIGTEMMRSFSYDEINKISSKCRADITKMSLQGAFGWVYRELAIYLLMKLDTRISDIAEMRMITIIIMIYQMNESINAINSGLAVVGGSDCAGIGIGSCVLPVNVLLNGIEYVIDSIKDGITQCDKGQTIVTKDILNKNRN